jgi:SEC-C motif-containing protein
VTRCRCHSGRTERRCCGPLHEGRPAPDPLALMRSRYAAYAKGLADYVADTTDPDGPQHRDDRAAWIAEIAAFCAATRFVGLDILDAPPPSGDDGIVVFRARIVQGGHDASFEERSRFRRRDGRWRYVGADAG